MIARVSDAVVQVSSEQCEGYGNGSGVVIGPSTVITAAHVVSRGEHFYVVGRAANLLSATVVAFVPEFDLAVLQVPDLPPTPAPELAEGFPRSNGVVLNRGPLGVEAHAYSLIRSVVASVPRVGGPEIDDRPVLEISARLQRGDSGGPLIDDQGRLAGIAFGVDPGNSGVAYASPAYSVRATLARVAGGQRFTPAVCASR